MKWAWTIAGLIPLITTWNAWANQIVHYQGTAKEGDHVAYLEKHTVEYDDTGKLLEAKTEYVSEAGKLIGELKSDFRESLTVPSHTIKDYRTGNVEGLRRDREKVILFDHDEGKAEKTRVLGKADAENRILVGCQGLNYYLLDNLGRLTPNEELPLRFLIPGKLDYYDFNMKKISESADGIVGFEVTVQNWFLKLFAPKLLVKYDKNKKQIVWYQGISNIKSDDGSNQNVTITYNYDKK